MMKQGNINPSLALVQQLLPLIDQYQKVENTKQADIRSFVLWLNKKILLSENKKVAGEQDLDSFILAGIWRMSKYARNYARLALQASPLKGIDDFVMLVALLQLDSLTKSEIILQTLTDFQTGIGILKRLSKLGLLEEFEDPEDKRSKRVRLSPAGRQLLGQLFREMSQVSTIVTADLQEQEKLELLTVLEHLDRFHLNIYQDKEYNNLDRIEGAIPRHQDASPID